MNILIKPMSDSINIEKYPVSSLNILDAHTYRLVIETIASHYNKYVENSDMVFIDKENNPINISKYTLPINDSYTFDLSSRPILTALIKDIKNQSVVDEEMIQSIEEDVFNLIGDIDTQSNHKLLYNSEIGLAEILKMLNIRLAASEYHSLLDRMYSIIDISRDLLDKKLLIFINHRPLLSFEDFANLSSYIEHSGLSVLFLDRSEYEITNSGCKMTIDEDLYCHIHAA